MRRFLVDSDVLIDVSKAVDQQSDKLREWLAEGDMIGITPIQVTEFFGGIEPIERKRWEEVFQSYWFWPISYSAAIQAACDQHELARVGQSIGLGDALTAAVAREQRAIVVTRNVRHYPQSDVQVLDFRR